MRLYLDDERPLPDGFDCRVETAAAAIALLAAGGVTALSLDHDLGPPEAGTGYDVAVWLERAAHLWSRREPGGLGPLPVTTHTANPVGRNRMEWAISRAMKFWKIGLAFGTDSPAPPPKPPRPRAKKPVDGYTPTGTEWKDWD